MSILKSTNSGRSSVELTLYYLLERGWYEPHKKDPVTGDILPDSSRICPCPQSCKVTNNNHFLYKVHDANGVARMSLQIIQREKSVNSWGIKPEYKYIFDVNTLGDLDLVLEYWYEDKINRKRAIKEKIMKLSKKESMMWFSEDISY